MARLGDIPTTLFSYHDVTTNLEALGGGSKDGVSNGSSLLSGSLHTLVFLSQGNTPTIIST